MVRSIRPVFDEQTGTGFGGSVAARFRPSTNPASFSTASQDSTGKLSCRVTGRYLRASLGFSGGFSGLHGLDVDARIGGPR
jgi:hypothetical protein